MGLSERFLNKHKKSKFICLDQKDQVLSEDINHCKIVHGTE